MNSNLQENVFNIPDPDEYKCSIQHFAIGHAMMEIHAQHATNVNDLFRIVFSFVEYFSGPIRWTGANFIAKSDGETLAILRTIEQFDQISDEHIFMFRPYRLYEVHTERKTIKILAAGGEIVNRMRKL